MAKRSAEIYLTDQNWDKEQPKEEAGAFTVASDNVLQSRDIIKAKRRCSTSGAEADSSNGGVFKSFTGLTGTSSVTTADSGASSFSFSTPLISDSSKQQKCMKMNALNKCLMEYMSCHLCKDPSCNLVPVFSDYQSYVSDISAKYSSDVEVQSSTTVSVASTCAVPAVPLSELFKKSSDSWVCSTCFVNNKNDASVCIACTVPRSTQSASCSVGSADSINNDSGLADGSQVPLSQLFQKSSDTWECPTCMIANKTSATTCAACSSVKPTTEHDVTSSVESTKPSCISLAPSGGFTFSFGNSVQSSGTGFSGFSFKPPTTVTETSSFKFGSSAAAAVSTDRCFSFKLPTNVTETSSFRFGSSTVAAVSTEGCESSSFVFSSPLQLGPAATCSFSFKPPQSSSASENKGNGDDDAEYVPQKPESVKHVEEGSFYSVRCKLFCKDGDSWKDRGTGYLFLKPCGDQTQLLIRADTATGNVLLNILLTSHIPASRQGTNNVSFVCAPTATQNSGDKCPSKTPACMLIRVKTSEMADELFDHISKCKDV